MKKKLLTNPFFEILLAIALLVVIVLIMNFCTSDKDLAQTNEMLEYHSSPDQLTIERDGYVTIIKQ